MLKRKFSTNLSVIGVAVAHIIIFIDIKKTYRATMTN